jgi:hypothetical protein
MSAFLVATLWSSVMFGSWFAVWAWEGRPQRA